MGGCFRQLKQVCLKHRTSTGGDFSSRGCWATSGDIFDCQTRGALLVF